MYTQKISLQEALKLEEAGKIQIVSTNSDSLYVHEDEPTWRSNYHSLRMKAPHVPLSKLFNHYNALYVIETKYEETEDGAKWRYFRGIPTADSSNIVDDGVEYVYALVNKDYPGLVKIGMTVKSPQKRLSSINSTGVVTHWELAFAMPLLPNTSYRVEQQVHKIFASKRHHAEHVNDKEMFNVDLEDAIDSIRSIGENFKAGKPKFYK